jgi:cardiolipin synthase
VEGDTLARIVTAGPDSDMEKIEYTMLQAITLARQSVRLMTPYFLPSERFLSELALAALRGSKSISWCRDTATIR